jgi:hypothetical protein
MQSRSKLTIAALIVVALAALGLVCRVTILAPIFDPTPTPTPTRTAIPTPTYTPTPTHTPTSTPTPTPTDTPTPTFTPTPTETPVPTSTPVPVLATTVPITPTTAKWTGAEATPVADCSAPRSPHSAIRGRRIISFYGTVGPGLGILGRYSISDTLGMLEAQIQPYRELDPCVEIVPAFHIIVTVADANPGADGDYNHRMAHEDVQVWIDGVAAAGGISVLDIQIARSTVDIELAYVEPLLRQTGVHLAVDPEFLVGEGEVPGTDLGTIDGETINAIQAWLNGVAEETGENKMLVIHQFDDRMASNKDIIQDYPLVDLVWDADGFGGPGAKVGDYQQYRGEGGFEYGGFKIFYNHDSPVMTPGQVMALDPPPAYIIYQ